MELDKKQLRKQLIQMRLAFDDYQKQSHFIIEKLKKDPRFIKSKKIGIYLSYKHEVDTWKLIEEFKTQKEFYVPIVCGKEMYFTLYQDKMIKNKYGIDEPIDKQEINKEFLDLMIVPLVGYDANCYRLGYGGGYYDRYLKDFNAPTIGLAYSFQYIEHYQSEDFDIPLKLRHTVTEIHGKERLTGVTLAQVDEKGTPIEGTEEEISCDTLLLAVGLIPENELSREAGIQIDPKTKGPVVNEMLETSLEGVFACGNVLHVHDLVDHVSEEAALAGIYAAEYVRTGQVFRESHSHGRQEV